MDKLTKKMIMVSMVIVIGFWVWGAMLIDLASTPNLEGKTGKVVSVIDNADFLYASVLVNGKVYKARIGTEVTVGKQISIYTEDNDNYWDHTEELRFLDSVLNKPSGMLAFGLTHKTDITVLANVMTIMGFVALVILIIYVYVLNQLQKRSILCLER